MIRALTRILILAQILRTSHAVGYAHLVARPGSASVHNHDRQSRVYIRHRRGYPQTPLHHRVLNHSHVLCHVPRCREVAALPRPVCHAVSFVMLSMFPTIRLTRLVPTMRRRERILSTLAILGSIIGGAGLILLSIFDTKRHHSAHRIFLLVFIVGVALSAIFTIAEVRRQSIVSLAYV